MRRSNLVLGLLLAGLASQALARRLWELNDGRYGASAAFDGRDIYVFGGSDGGLVARGSIEKIDLATGEVSLMAQNLEFPRRFHSVAAIRNRIYVFGGENREGFVSFVEEFDFSTDQRRLQREMPLPRRTLSAVAVEDLIFVLGGMAPDSSEAWEREPAMHIFDPAKNNWLRAPDMPKRKEVAAVKDRDFIYALGGYNGTGRAETSAHRYNLATGSWEELPPVPFALSANSAASLGGAIICFGSYDRIGQVAVFLPTSQQWLKLDLAFTPRRHSAACVAGDTVYVIGGCQDSRAIGMKTIERYKIADLKKRIVAQLPNESEALK